MTGKILVLRTPSAGTETSTSQWHGSLHVPETRQGVRSS